MHSIDHHLLASVSIAATCLDVLGTLYLAYDLLGGEHGPLGLLTRAVTYSIVFGIGYAIGLGFFFGLVSGVVTGVTVAIELNRTARKGGHYSLPWEVFFSAVRATGFAAGLYPIVGLRFVVAFGILITGGQVIAYSRGMRPSIGLCGCAAAAPYAQTILGDGGQNAGLQCRGVGLQHFRAASGAPVAVCGASRSGDRSRYRRGHSCESLYRILRRPVA